MWERSFRAMNSDVSLLSPRPDAESRLDRAEKWLHAFERRFSRFQPDSELSRLNRHAGEPLQVSPALYQLVELALEFARASDGLFDPTILRQLEQSGYDRSFEAIPLARPANSRTAASRTTWSDVRLDASRRTVTLPEESGIDLGGMGKGWAVDRLAAILGSPSLVNCGGDVFASGMPPDDTGWRVGVADPFAPRRRSGRAPGKRTRRRDVEQRQATLEGGRPLPAPPDRPAHRRARPKATRSRSRSSRLRRACRRAREGRAALRRGRRAGVPGPHPGRRRPDHRRARTHVPAARASASTSQKRENQHRLRWRRFGAGDETRTRDPLLGKMIAGSANLSEAQCCGFSRSSPSALASTRPLCE